MAVPLVIPTNIQRLGARELALCAKSSPSTARTRWGAPAINRLVVIAVPIALFGSACMSVERGTALENDVQQLKQELAAQRAQSQEGRERLKQVLEQATGLLTRDSADVGAQLEQLQQELARLSGLNERTGNTVSALAKRVSSLEEAQTTAGDQGSSSAARPKPLPEDKDELFALGSNKLGRGSHQQGRRLIRHFIARYPKDARASRAQLLLGNSYFSTQKFAPAIQEYRKVVEHHKGSPEVPEALFSIGMSFYQLKFCTDAELFFKELIDKHRKHHRTKRAGEVLKLIRRYRRNKRVCSS